MDNAFYLGHLPAASSSRRRRTIKVASWTPLVPRPKPASAPFSTASVGLREIIDIKHGGIEKYGIKVHYLGTSVPVEKLVNAAVELDACGGADLRHQDVYFHPNPPLSLCGCRRGDVRVGLQGAVDDLCRNLGAEEVQYETMLATSSAAGGLRMTVHGLVYDMTVEAVKEAAPPVTMSRMPSIPGALIICSSKT